MKLNAVAVDTKIHSQKTNKSVGIFAGFVLTMMLGASPAVALDGIDLSEAATPAAAGECPALIKIKYPFLSCSNGQIGMTSKSDTWDNSRQIPRQSEFNEGNGYWGDELNSGWTR